MKLLRHSDTPLYRQVEHILRQRIEAGELGPGDGIPAEIQLARELSPMPNPPPPTLTCSTTSASP